jgi:cytochrome P450
MTNPALSPADIDLADPDLYRDGVPHDVFAALRRDDPGHFNPEDEGPGFWAFTRYEDIRAIHRDPTTFSSELGGVTLEDLEPHELEARKSMIDMDPPRHDEIRAVVHRGFTPRAVSAWEDRVRSVASEVIDAALPQGEFDFVEQISAEIPMQVFARVMGIPQEERHEVIRLGNRLLGRDDPEFAMEPDAADRMLPLSNPVALEIFEIGRRIAAARRADPQDDVVSKLVARDLTPKEFDLNFVLLAVAGNETTRHTLTHGLLALLEHPEQMELLRSEPEKLTVATEEILRWATPIHYFRRTAARDVELAGSKVKAGDKVTTWLVSGNRDESHIADPDIFDVERAPNPHVTFGPGGIHHCLGAHLARLEIRVTIHELLKRSADIELAGPPERLRSNLFNGIKRLPVRVR